MSIDPNWMPVISGFVGGAVVWVGGMITDFIKYRREEKNRVREERQKWLGSRKNAYYNLISDDLLPTSLVSPQVESPL